MAGWANTASLYSPRGERKYINAAERVRFIAAAKACPRPEIGALCLTLAYTGCRISEALALTPACVNADSGFIAIRSLKKRNRAVVIREVPIPGDLLNALDRCGLAARSSGERLWPLSRSRAWQLIKLVMAQAEIAPGPHGTPKGLRHGYGIHALRSKVPITLVKRWLGHARLSTTEIYLQVMGDDEREIAARMWA